MSPGMTREQAGVSYYGIGELSGNVGIGIVTVGNLEGRSFTGLHGDGRLLETGLADVPSWPSTHGVGAGFRGGAFQSPSSSLLVSQRHSAATGIVGHHSGLGFRGVRSAP